MTKDLLEKILSHIDGYAGKLKTLRLTLGLKILVAAILALAVMGGCMPHTTGETQVGVRTRKLGLISPKGVEEQVYAPGATYFFLPFINDWNVFDTKLQNLEMTFSKIRGDRRSQDDLVFKTIDGNDISLDVIIAYRIDASKAPYILQYVARDDVTLRDTIVRTVARSKPRDIFGELKTEAFYVAEAREAQSTKAKDALQQILGPMGIVIEKVLTNDYRFNPQYTKAIQAEGIAEAKGIQQMNNALAGAGGEAIVKLKIAEALQGKRIILLPVSEGGMNLKTTDINRLIETLGVKSLSGAQ